MASITDLKKSITHMVYEDALLVIRECRDLRRVAPARKIKTKRITQNKKRVIDPFSVIRSMSDAQKEELKKQIMDDLLGD